MTRGTLQVAAQRVLSGAPLAFVWTAYLPLGAKYLVAALAATAAGFAWRQRRPQTGPALPPMAALLALLVISAGWSPASWAEIGSHWGLYALMLLVPWLAPALAADSAQRALAHFAALSAAVAALFVLQRLQWLAPSVLWSSTVEASGNQRICNSLLLALGAVLALREALVAGASPGRRAAWIGCAALVVVGLALQDRRTGMLTLPVVLLAWAWVAVRSLWQRLGAVVLVLAAAAAAAAFVDDVRGRFDEGLHELRADVPTDRVATSWGQRLHMAELTAAMVQERPWAGHGVASWHTLWQQRVPPGGPLAANTTPHNEYLLVAQQIGLPGLALLVWVLAASLGSAARAGPAGVPALMVWSALAWAGLFNAVLRDAKFSLILLMLAALATAACTTHSSKRAD